MNQPSPLSPGCLSCEQGKWLCIFLTYLCNGHCTFCPMPIRQEDRVASAFGSEPGTIAQYLAGGHFNGISFSGGDSFLVFPRLLQWLTFFKERFPGYYYWVYTNGLAVDEQKLQQLADSGLDEIRFNIAASHYDSPHILESIALSARLFPAVAVEIPSIPADYEKLVRVLPILAEKQVKYLNLHEYILMPGDPASSSLPAATFILDKKDKITFATQSMANTEKIIRFCHDHAIGLTINNCSLSHKEHQMCQRHVVMADILKKEYEKPTSCGYLETYLVHPRVSTGAALQELMKVAKGFPLSQLEPFLVHPDQYRNSPLRTKALRLTFISPLGIDSPRRLFRIEEIRKN